MEMIDEAAADYDLVIVDAPPLLGFAEPLQMATAVDGVLVVARAGRTTRKAVATVLATLNRVRAKTDRPGAQRSAPRAERKLLLLRLLPVLLSNPGIGTRG